MKTLFPPTEESILAAVMDACKELGLSWEILEQEDRSGSTRADAWVRLGVGGAKTLYEARVKRGLRPATLGVVQQQLAELGDHPLLVADYVSPPLAETLRRRDIQFIDAAGNAYIKQPHLFVWVKGQWPIETPLGGKTTGRVFQPTGLMVVFSLLCQPAWVDRAYRDIAHHAGVAHGTVGWVMPELARLGYVATVNGKRRLLNAESLLRQWVEAYALTLRPRLLLGRYRADDLGWTANLDALKYNMLLGGEPGAQALTGQLRPGTATLYGEKVEPRLLLDQRLLTDPAGNVEIMKRFWTFETEPPGLAPLILIYADLLAIGDARCLEAGKQIYGRIVDRFN